MSRVTTTSALDRGARPDELRAPGFQAVQVAPVIENLGPTRSSAGVALAALQGLAGVAQAAAGLGKQLSANQQQRLNVQTKADNNSIAIIEQQILESDGTDFEALMGQSRAFSVEKQNQIQRAVVAREKELLAAGKAVLKDQTALHRSVVTNAVATGDEDRIATALGQFRLHAEGAPEGQRGEIFAELERLVVNGAEAVDEKLTTRLATIKKNSNAIIQAGINEINTNGTFEEANRRFTDTTNIESRSFVYQSIWVDSLTDIIRKGLLASKGLPEDAFDQDVEDLLATDIMQNTISLAASTEVRKWIVRNDGEAASQLQTARAELDATIQTTTLGTFTQGGKAPDRDTFRTQYEGSEGPTEESVQRGNKAFDTFYEDQGKRLIDSVTNADLSLPWMEDERAAQSFLAIAPTVEGLEGQVGDLQRAVGRVRARFAVAQYLETPGAKALSPSARRLEGADVVATNLIRNEALYSGLFADLPLETGFTEILTRATLGANDLSLDPNVRARFQRAEAHLLQVQDSLELGRTTSGKTAERNFDVQIRADETGNQLLETINAMKENRSLPPVVKAQLDMVAAQIKKLAVTNKFFDLDSSLSEDPNGNLFKATIELTIVSESLRHNNGREADFDTAANTFVELIGDAISTTPDVNQAQINGELAGALRASWQRLSSLNKTELGGRIYKGLTGLTDVTPIDEALMSQEIANMFDVPQTAGVTQKGSMTSFIENARDRSRILSIPSKEIDLKGIRPDGIAGAQQFIANRTGVEPFEVPPHLATIMLSDALRSAKDPSSISVQEMRAAYTRASNQVGILTKDASGTIGLVRPGNGLAYLPDATIEERQEAIEDLVLRSSSSPAMGFLTNVMYGTGGEGSTALLNVANQWRKDIGKFEVSSDDPTFRIGLGVANQDGFYRFMLLAEDPEDRDVIPLTGADGVSDWVLTGEQLESFTAAVGLGTTFEGLARDELKLLEDIRDDTRRLEISTARTKIRQAAILARSPGLFPAGLETPRVEVSLTDSLKKNKLELLTVTERMASIEREMLQLTLLSAQGPPALLEKNLESTKLAINEWATSLRRVAPRRVRAPSQILPEATIPGPGFARGAIR